MEDENPRSEQRMPGAAVGDGVYEEIYRNIRATDDYSFKLLGLAPLVSGGGIFALLAKSGSGGWPAWSISVLSFWGAIVTLGLFCWELRNIQTCEWLRGCAAGIERRLDFPDRPKSKRILGISVRKRTGEAVVYLATIVAWLTLAFAPALGSHVIT